MENNFEYLKELTKENDFEIALRKGIIDDEILLDLAKKSPSVYVISDQQIAEDSPQAKGKRLTAFETLLKYGKEILKEVVMEGSCLI